MFADAGAPVTSDPSTSAPDEPNPGTSKPQPLVGFIVVTHNRRVELMGCLESIRRQNYTNKQIIVVDNGSEDGTGEAVRQHFPEANIVALSDNLGAAAGRNRAIEVTSGSICVLLDDDAYLIDPDATECAVKRLEGDPKLAVISFQVCSASTSLPERRNVPFSHKRIPLEDTPCAYFSSCGAAIRKSALCEVGGFWEMLFWGGEELELSYRVLDLGYTMMYAPTIRVAHLHTATARPKGRWVYSAARNRCWVAVRHLPWLYAGVTTVAWWGYTAITSLRHGQFRHFAQGVRDAIRGLPEVVSARTRIRPETVRQLRHLSGRLWY